MLLRQQSLHTHLLSTAAADAAAVVVMMTAHPWQEFPCRGLLLLMMLCTYTITPPPPPPPLHTFLFTTFLFWMFLPPKHDTAILLFTSQIFLWVKTMSRPVLKYFLASYRVKCFLKISCIIFHLVWEVSQSWMHQDIFLCVLLWVRCPLGNIPLHTFSKQCYLICPKEILQGCP